MIVILDRMGCGAPTTPDEWEMNLHWDPQDDLDRPLDDDLWWDPDGDGLGHTWYRPASDRP